MVSKTSEDIGLLIADAVNRADLDRCKAFRPAATLRGGALLMVMVILLSTISLGK